MKKIIKKYKPKKVTISGKCKILSNKDGKCVVKEKKQDISELHSYLETRGFDNYPEIINEKDSNYVYEYIDHVNIPIDQKSSDMAYLLASLHDKTSYYKPITADYIKEIHESIEGNINYVENFYKKLFEEISKDVVMSPSNYLLIRNSSKLLSNFDYIKKELENWFKLMVDKTKERVSYCHNNLNIDHYLKSSKDYFISWDNYTIDSPVLDLINLYKSDYDRYEFSNFLENYNQTFKLSKEEKKLFFIVISLPKIVKLNKNEYDNTKEINELLTYIYKTEKLIRPYYSPENIE